MKRLSPQLLARYHDDELSPAETKKVEAMIELDKNNSDGLHSLERMGELIRLMKEEKASEVSFEGFSARVLAGIKEQQKPPLGERLRVWWSEFLEHRKTVWIPAAGLATACLAILLAMPFVTGTPNSQGGEELPEIWTASADSGRVLGSTVDSVDFGDISGKVYELDNDHGGTTAVVWIVDNSSIN